MFNQHPLQLGGAISAGKTKINHFQQRVSDAFQQFEIQNNGSRTNVFVVESYEPSKS